MANSKYAHTQGLLSISKVAALLHVSIPTARKYFDRNLFNGIFRTATSRDRFVPAPALREYLLTNNMPEPQELQDYIDRYNKHFTNSEVCERTRSSNNKSGN